ncbi:hypothetical protein K9M42_02860 [Patescibacteria group bacterium]|nr:hypothetical protein [Patescibacteria group bacterium]
MFADKEIINFLILFNFDKNDGKWIRILKEIDFSEANNEEEYEKILSGTKENIIREIKQSDYAPDGQICITEHA